MAILVLLLAVLATLQYRWIAQLSEADWARLKEELDLAAAGYCENFDREIARAYSVFTLNRVTDERELSHELADRSSRHHQLSDRHHDQHSEYKPQSDERFVAHDPIHLGPPFLNG